MNEKSQTQKPPTSVKVSIVIIYQYNLFNIVMRCFIYLLRIIKVINAAFVLQKNDLCFSLCVPLSHQKLLLFKLIN